MIAISYVNLFIIIIIMGGGTNFNYFHQSRTRGVNFYLDLDVVILENIDKFITFSKDDEFSITRDFSYPTKGFNSSVMK